MVGEDQDDVVLIPFTTVKKRLEGSTFADVHMIFVSAVAHQRMTEAQDQSTRLLMERHRIKPGNGQDFHIENTDEISRIVGIVTGTMTLMLSAIAGISLVVGGVGIMNFFLVSVSGRPRKIGLRMAVATPVHDI